MAAAAAAAGARKLAGTLRLLAAGRGSGCIPRARASPCETTPTLRRKPEKMEVPLVAGRGHGSGGSCRLGLSASLAASRLAPSTTLLYSMDAADDGVLSFLRHHDWDILVMEAHLHVPSDDDKQKTLKINLIDCPDHPSRVSDCESIPWEREEQES
uniref:Uncharacterized protein n=1 Tax=Oryza rufipogon TaxID=4529 RepID=A0A0E0NL52_ORYRU